MAELKDRVLDLVTRASGESCNFILDTKIVPFQGGQRTVFALQSSSMRRFAVRAERHVTSATRSVVEREVQLLRAVTKAQIPRLPRLIDFEMEPDPPLIATSWADGNPLKWNDATPAPDIRQHVLQAIAELNLDMLKVQEPGASALGWITSKILKTRIDRARNGDLLKFSLSDAVALGNRVSEFHVPDLDSCPHVLVHGDLQPLNIIMNGDKLECVIDFGLASMVPLQFAATYPGFLVNEPQQIAGNYDWSGCDYTNVQIEDRCFYLQCIQNLASTRGEHAQNYARVLARDDYEEWHWWLSAVNRVDMMTALSWKPPTTAILHEHRKHR